MKKILATTTIAIAATLVTAEMYARYALQQGYNCADVGAATSLLLSAVQDHEVSTVQEAIQWRGPDSTPYTFPISDASWEVIVLDVWTKREPTCFGKFTATCEIDYVDSLTDPIEVACHSGEYRPNVWYLVKQGFEAHIKRFSRGDSS